MPFGALWIKPEYRREAEATCFAAGIAVTFGRDLPEAIGYLAADRFSAMVISVSPEGTHPDLLIGEARRGAPDMPVIVHAPEATLAQAVAWTKQGASEVVREESDALLALAAAAKGRAPEGAREELPAWRRLLLGQSNKIQNISEIVRLIAPRRCTVLITGETGTGKEVVARAIHAAGNRAHLPMVAVNCGALPENLLEAELFGHVKGAFTGAAANRMGRFEQANRSTLFLDEVGDMPIPLQTKLLRVLQEREFQKLGSSETIRADVRIIAATNATLLERVREGGFREDLYYRLNVVPIAVPALRERPEDIPILTQHFLAKICRAEGIPVKRLSGEVLRRLECYDWPGNVRQLENAAEMAIALSGDREILYPSDFPLPAFRSYPTEAGKPFIAVPDHGLDFERTVGRIELSLLDQALKKSGGNKKMAADMLHLKRTTLAAKLKSLAAAPGVG